MVKKVIQSHTYVLCGVNFWHQKCGYARIQLVLLSRYVCAFTRQFLHLLPVQWVYFFLPLPPCRFISMLMPKPKPRTMQAMLYASIYSTSGKENTIPDTILSGPINLLIAPLKPAGLRTQFFCSKRSNFDAR